MISLHYPQQGPGWRVTAIGTYVPDTVVPNGEIEDGLGLAPGWIEQRTGIRRRHHVRGVQTILDLAVTAAGRALAHAGVRAGELAGLIFATTSPDRITPGLGYSLQHRLGAHAAAVLDVNAGCAGLVHALHLAGSLASTGQFDGPVLVVGAEHFSTFLDPSDRPTAVLFGDGAGAILLAPGPTPGLIRTAIGSDGYVDEGAEVSIGGRAGGGTVKMDGRFVAEYIRNTFPVAVKAVLDGTGIERGDIDHVVPHQANVKLIRQVAAENGITGDQLCIAGDRYGNTGTASIPLTMDLHRLRFRAGDTVLLVALGGGMNWAATLLRMDRSLAAARSGAVAR